MKLATLAGPVLSAALALTVSGQSAGARNDPQQQDPQPPRATSAGPRVVTKPLVVQGDRHDTSPALRDIAPRPAPPDRQRQGPLHLRPSGRHTGRPDAALQTSMPVVAAPSTIINFEGVHNVDGVLPPDTNGGIGPNHYVQWVNKTFAIYSRSGNLLYGPAAGRTIWAGFGGPCEAQNDGDPIVLYDHLADRWLMTQFALPNYLFGVLLMAPFYQCIAVSQTPDPTGPYHRYQYGFQKLNDYPKFGVWPDGYYMAINQFSSITLAYAGQGVAAFDRDAMLAGQPARMIYYDLWGVDPNLGGMLPSDLDGPPPPPGSPNYFVQMDDDANGYSPDQLQLWRFRANWTTPSQSTFTGPYTLPVAAFDSNLCDQSRNCIPQPGTSVKLDALADRLMYRLQYRNFGTHQTLVVNHTVDVDGNDHAGIRWYEIRDPGGTPTVHQQGTFAPDSFHRWMASAAMDAAGNLAIAYNVSGSTLSPSIRYAARLATDPPGVLGQGENDLIAGSGSQTHTASRWGDYSLLDVDPVDGCTFWMTAEYMAVTSLAGWQTRIGAFRLPSCGNAGPPPAAPDGLSAAAASPTRIDLAWTDRSDDESGFTIERCAGTAAACDASGVFVPVRQTGPDVIVYSDTPLQPATTFTYRVRAYNFGGNSANSNLADATTEAAPSVTVVATVATASEVGPTSGVFLVTRSAGYLDAQTVQYSLGGSATGGIDYEALPGVVTIPAGAASATVTVVPIDDATIEPDETIVLTLQPATGYVVGMPSSATIVIVSDDRAVDFMVSSLTPPVSAGAGTTIQIGDVTSNQGTDASGPSVTHFYLSSNYTLEPSDTLLGTRSVPALAPGAASSSTTEVTLPGSLAPGYHLIIAKADGPGAIAETSETNNTRTAVIRIGSDLSITSLIAPASVAVDVPFVVSDTTANQGGGTAGTSFTQFYLSSDYLLDSADTRLQGRQVPELAAGASSAATTTLTVPATVGPGSYYLIARADDRGEVPEHTETNNVRYVIVRVGGDLVVSALSVPLRAANGSTIVVSDTTANSGASAVGSSTTAFYLSADYLLDAGDIRLPQSRAVPALLPGATSAGSVSVTLPVVTAGAWYVIAQADDANTVAEANESNNRRFTSVQIGPDLIVASLSVPTTAVAGGTIVASETIRNLGADAAGASTTRFYLSTNAVLDASDILLDGTRAVPALAPNASHSGSTTLVLPGGVSGQYYIIAVADGAGEVGEANETNNTAARVITVGK